MLVPRYLQYDKTLSQVVISRGRIPSTVTMKSCQAFYCHEVGQFQITFRGTAADVPSARCTIAIARQSLIVNVQSL